MTDKIINISDIKFFLYLITKQNNFKLFNYYIYKKRKKKILILLSIHWLIFLHTIHVYLNSKIVKIFL